MSASGKSAEGCAGVATLRRGMIGTDQHFLLGWNVKGSSLPNCSGMPDFWNLSKRACVRWQASRTISGVDATGLVFVAGAAAAAALCAATASVVAAVVAV